MTLPACCLDLNIDPLQLLFPDRLDADGLEFVTAHGLTALSLEARVALLRAGRVLENRNVEIRHRCANLGDDGRCQIYASRPTICRDYDCSKRHDCACGGQGVIDLADIAWPGSDE